MIPHPSRKVAEQILWLRNEVATTPLHIIKLVYLCHGWMLGIHETALIDEPVEAWRYGPVVPSVYRTFKSFRGNPITIVPVDKSESINETEMILIEAVLDAYGEYTAWQLSSITHQPGSPWEQIYRNGRGENAIISNEIIQKYYGKRANDA